MNGSKCGVIHFRRKGEERSKASFNVGQEAIRMVQEYKYLGCVVVASTWGIRTEREGI